ncbi:MAG: response regulator transcription factor [Bacteroidetes bacterium]|nr:response regulator transcription factor [Bacteroidota bacterium]MBS1740932.1 response regulator transcription factor [Bacteroidota bacterium]MBS1776992.1 response regulator transcription factor [Bacteroidota bacterium]
MIQKQKIKVCLIEDDQTIREGYAFLLGTDPDIKVVSNYRNFETAVKKIVLDNPNVLLLDIELPGISGIEAIAKLKKLLPSLHIIILTVYEHEQYIFSALAAGAVGYLTKSSSPEKIISSIKEVMEGGGPMSAHIARMVIASFKRNEQSPLTKRETEILELIATGKGRKRIAEDLFIDLETVKSHIKNIYGKLKVHSKADAIKAARENKFI